MFYAYLLRSLSHPDETYVGSTSNLRTRLSTHNTGGSPHTARFRPWVLEFYAAFPTEELAVAFECYLKTHSGREFADRHFRR